MKRKTCLYNCHLKANAKMVDFAGWEMPLHYGSQLQEHQTVRETAGVFDVSHMTILDVTGIDAATFLQFLFSNNIGRLISGKALYTCMLNENGGVLDDLIVYKISEDHYRLILNSATREKDLKWIEQQSQPFSVKLIEQKNLAILAVQGPDSKKALSAFFSNAFSELKPFHFMEESGIWVARTGYTGELGYEIILPAEKAPEFWEKLLASSVKPCGLGARDTLRLEAGLNLYGADMDETVTPLESNLAWTVAWEPETRHFMGREVLEQQRRAGVEKNLVGLVLEVPGVLRNHQRVLLEDGSAGEITSGSFSPTLNKGIALARIPVTMEEFVFVEMRGKRVPAKIVKPPFVNL